MMLQAKLRGIYLNARYALYLIRSLFTDGQCSASLFGVVFSKDRPLQLSALIESYFHCVKDPCPLLVQFTASNARYKNSYRILALRYQSRGVRFVEETSFRKTLISGLGDAKVGRVFFLVDDIVFNKSFSIGQFSFFDPRWFIPSMRLGKNIVRSGLRRLPSGNPHFMWCGLDGLCFWSFWAGRKDWRYVFSVDGNIYSVPELLFLMKLVEFRGPNSFEAQLNRFRFAMRFKIGVCFTQSVLFNIPLNRVQCEIDNPSGDVAPNMLLEEFESGLDIDLESIYGTNNDSPHYQVPLKKRGQT